MNKGEGTPSQITSIVNKLSNSKGLRYAFNPAIWQGVPEKIKVRHASTDRILRTPVQAGIFRHETDSDIT